RGTYMSAPKGLLAANLVCMISMVVWAAGLPANAILLPLLPPLSLSAARFGMAAAALLPFWVLVEGFGVLRGAQWLKGSAVGGMIGIGGLCVILGQSLTDAVTVAVISATMPVVAIAIEVVLDGRRLTLAIVAGLALAVVGGIIALGGGVGGLSLGLGALICFGSVLFFTFGSRLTVTAFPVLTPLGRTTVTLTGAAIATLIIAPLHALTFGPMPNFGQLGPREWGALVVFAVGSLAVSQVLWIISVGKLGIGLAALHINAAPFYVMLILFAFGDPWNWQQAFGAAIVGLGVLVAQGIIPLQRKPIAV
ncbi:DMT family transporter, partial [Cypionkella sp.]|uniref:DMT family transporter n=1 Tax=Cypionkella sp. TaxID=2811411 RepID=UPI0026238D90